MGKQVLKYAWWLTKGHAPPTVPPPPPTNLTLIPASLSRNSGFWSNLFIPSLFDPSRVSRRETKRDKKKRERLIDSAELSLCSSESSSGAMRIQTERKEKIIIIKKDYCMGQIKRHDLINSHLQFPSGWPRDPRAIRCCFWLSDNTRTCPSSLPSPGHYCHPRAVREIINYHEDMLSKRQRERWEYSS